MDYFAHRVHKADLANGVVTLHLSMVRPNAEGKIDPDAPVAKEDVSFTVNLPLQGFMRSMGVLRELIKELQERGILKAPDGEGREGGEGEAALTVRERPGGRPGGPGGRGPGGPGGMRGPGGPGGPGGRGPGGPGGMRGPGGPRGPQDRPQVRDITNEDDSSEPLV